MGEVLILPCVRVERETGTPDTGPREAVRKYFADAGWNEPDYPGALARVDDFMIWLWMQGFVIRKAEEIEEG